MELLYTTGKTWPMLAAQEDFSLGAFSIGHRVLAMQIIPGVRCKVTFGSCASMQNKEKHSHNTDRLDKLETTVPEPERQIPLPIVGFLSPRLNVVPFVGRNGAPSVHSVHITLAAALL